MSQSGKYSWSLAYISETNHVLTAILNAQNKRAFNNIKGGLLMKFGSNPSIVNLLERYSSIRSNFVAYEINLTPYSLKRRGSSPSEKKHSSIVRFLRNDFTSELPELLSALL